MIQSEERSADVVVGPNYMIDWNSLWPTGIPILASSSICTSSTPNALKERTKKPFIL